MRLDVLLNLSIASGALTLAALAAERALSATGRPTRGVWAGVMLATLGATFVLISGGSLPLSVRPEILAAWMGSAAATGAAAGDLDPSGQIFNPLLAWAGVSVLLLAAIGAFALAQHRRLGTGRPETIDGVRVLVTDRLGPAVAGLIRTRIVVPAWLLELPRPERGLVVRHEAEHAAAHDHHVSVAGLVLCCLLPWNPLLWIQLARLRLAIEVDCDRRVLDGSPEDRARYGNLLIDVAGRSARGTPLATTLSHPRTSLERRIRMIIQPSGGRLRALAWGIGAAVLAVVACSDVTEPPASKTDAELVDKPVVDWIAAPVDESAAGELRLHVKSKYEAQAGLLHEVREVPFGTEMEVRLKEKASEFKLREESKAQVAETEDLWFPRTESGD